MKNDPQEIINNGRMSGWQIVAVIVAICLNALDGFDVAAVSFASPSIAAEWNVSRDVLGWVLSMELIGMAVGSVLMGGIADLFGRRPVIIASLILMALGMFFASGANSVVEMSLCRLFTGFGIGGMIATLTALVVEFSNCNYKNLVISILVVGYPSGAVLSGTIARLTLENGSWRSIFEVGAIAASAMIPLTWFLIPESPAYLCARQPKNALARINRTLKKFHLSTIEALPYYSASDPHLSILDIFNSKLRQTTILVTFAYITQIGCYYFIMKWVPQIVVDIGFSPSIGADVLVLAMVGAMVGAPIFGFLARRFPVKATTIGALIGSTFSVLLFGNSRLDVNILMFFGFFLGFFLSSSGIGFYALAAHAYPAHARGAGTGFVVGAGRMGATSGPALAGILFHSGLSMPTIFTIMACGPFLAAVAIWKLRVSEGNLTGRP